MAGAESTSVGLLVRQLEERAAKFRELAQPFSGRLFLAPIRRLAQDPATWRGDITTAFGGWLDAFDSWIQNDLGQPLVDLALRIEHRVKELEDLASYAGLGVCPASPRPMKPIGTEPGGLPGFILQLPHPPRERVSMTPDKVRTLAKALSGAQMAMKTYERQVRDALAPVVVPPPEPELNLGPASAHLPPDAAQALGQPTWYLAAAVELDKARAEITARAMKWEEASRASDGMAVLPTLAGLVTSLDVLRARAVERAATGRSSPFATSEGARLLATPRNKRRQAESDAKRVLDRLRSGLFHMQDRKGAERILGRAAKEAASPEYAAAFLNQLGPKGLRKLLDEGLDPCLVSEVAARASTAGVDLKFLKDALGKNRADKPVRAAQLAGCNCPASAFHPVWAEYLVTTLYKAPDTKPLDPPDPREWYRDRASVVIREHLARPPRGMEPEAGEALEHVVIFGVDHEFDPLGKRALALALTSDDIIFNALAIACVPGADTDGRDPVRFDPPRGAVTSVLPDLMADPDARRIMLQAADLYAGDQLALAATRSAKDAASAMERVGGLFGALASRPYSTQAVLDIQKAAAKSARSLLEKAGGKVIEAAKLAPVVALAVEGGSMILFDTWEGTSAHRESEQELKGERKAGQVRDQLRADLQADIEHLTYVAILADADQRHRLGLRLSRDDVPQVTSALAKEHNLGRTTRAEWQRILFDEHGQLRVPDPSDGRRWMLFRAWAATVNPDLTSRVRDLTAPAFDIMSGIGTS